MALWTLLMAWRNPHTDASEESSMTAEEWDAAILEAPYEWSQLVQLVKGPTFPCELSVAFSGIWCAAKCLVRLDIELKEASSVASPHPVFWIIVFGSMMMATIEGSWLASAEQALIRCRRVNDDSTETLTTPLMSNEVGDEERPTTERPRDDGEHIQSPQTAQLRDFIAVVLPDAQWISIAMVFLVLASVAQVYVPRLTGAVLDSLLSNNGEISTSSLGVLGDVAHNQKFTRNVELLVTMSILAGVFGGLRASIFSMIGARVNARLRIRLLDSILSQEIGFFDTTRTGDITSRLSSDTTIVGLSLTTMVNVFLRSSLMAVGYLIFMATISWQLSVLSFITIPVVSMLSKWYGQYLRRLSRLQQTKLADANAVAEAALGSMATVRACGAEAVELREFESLLQKFLTLNVKTAVTTFGYTTCVNALPELVKALVLFYGGLLVKSGRLSGGDLISFVLYLSALSNAFNSLAGVYASLVRAVGAADKVYQLMHRLPKRTLPQSTDVEFTENDSLRNEETLQVFGLGKHPSKILAWRNQGIRPATCNGNITFSNVRFSYPARPESLVLDGLNLQIEAGSIVALVGMSGSGKSSIIKLIQNLYEPESGEILIDGYPVHQINPDWMSRHVAVVQQEPVLFARSVKENILYGVEHERNHDDMERAAQLANASDFISSFEANYEAQVGERGVTLSGGQKQRVAIARALVRSPAVLLLDEATSALDSQSESVVQTAIDDMIREQRNAETTMTVVIVAHRLSTVRNADRIIVIQKGQVAEEGTHDELETRMGGVYAGLIQQQRNA